MDQAKLVAAAKAGDSRAFEDLVRATYTDVYALAYRLTEKTVIRTGFGISYTPFPDNSWMYNYPVRSNNLYAQAKGSTDTYGPAILPDGRLASFENGFPAPVAVPACLSCP